MTTQLARSQFMGRRQRRVEQRRQEILDAAAHIFAELGYANATTRAVADAADVAEGTLYNYFDSKRDILLAIAERAENEVATLLGGTGRVESVAEMVALVEQGLRLLVANLSFTRTLWLEAWADDEILREFAVAWLKVLHARIQVFIEEQISHELFRPVDPTLASTMVLGLVFAPIFPVLRGMIPPPTGEQLHATARAAVEMMLHGLNRVGTEPAAACAEGVKP